MKKVVYVLLIIFMIFGSNFSQAATSNYCSLPPFITEPVKPNVVLLMDFSGSMQFPAYYSCAGWAGYWGSKVADCAGYNVNYYAKQNYDANKDYYGIFDPDKYYKYDSNKKYFIDNTNNCSYTDRIGSQPDCISGNLLNFITTTRIDAALKALIGAKADCDSNYCYLKAQGSVRLLKVGNINCKFFIRPQSYWTGDYSNKKILLTAYNYNGSCPLYGLSDAHVVVQVNKSYRNGIVQRNFNKVRFTFMVFGGDREGVVRYGFNDDNMSLLIDKMQTEVPYYGTPTGEAMWEVDDYLKQSNNNNYESNSAYIDKGSIVDPYYQKLPDGSIVPTWCRKSYVVLISDGEWNGDVDPVKPAYYLRTEDLRTDIVKKQQAKIFPVFVFDSSDKGKNSMKTISAFGSFTDISGCSTNWPYTFDKFPDNSKNVIWPRNDCDPSGIYKSCCKEWDAKDQNGVPDTYYQASNGGALESDLTKVFSEIFKAIASGTSASVLATNEKSGTVILQALFYPNRNFDNGTKINWAGSLNNMWFYLGPFVQNIREDTDKNNILNLFDDYVIQFFFDNSTNMTKVHIWKDSNGDGTPDTYIKDEDSFDVKYLWDAGKILWNTLSSGRKIFTDIDNLTDNATEGNFIVANASKLETYLNADNITQAENIIEYIRGRDIEGYRNRTVTIGSASHVWKLGDIIYSTPSILSGEPINSYYKNPPYGYGDSTYRQFVNSSIYKNRGMVFVGANDGMLHAFRLGKVVMLHSANGNIAKLEKQPADIELGSEAWGFIPKNLLPYLKYYMDKNYCHLYYVDLTPYVFDASIGKPGENDDNYYEQTKTGDDNTWRTILVGGLNFGGACGDNVTGAINPPSGIPQDTGRSSYFALDVTDPENPKVLWEFADNNTAFTTTGPAIVHIPYKNADGSPNSTKRGYWYVVFASGPDNYNGTVHQPLYLYVLDLKTGKLKHKWQLSGNNCSSSSLLTCQTGLIGNYNAFAGRMFESSVDLGTNYSDDGVYFGYNYKDSDWKGGVLRLVTYDDPNPADWKVSKLIGDIGPVTSSVRTLEDAKNHNLWVYFGEGRYFTKGDDAVQQRAIYGVKDPCYNGAISYEANCPTALTRNDLTDVTNDANASIDNSGWYIDLSTASGDYNAERMITDPVVSNNGWVFWTTFMPTSDLCGFGGDSYVWMVNYDNGGTPKNVEGSLYVQLSTGAIKKINLKEQFGLEHSGNSSSGRKLSSPLVGSPPPSAGMTIVLPPNPLGDVIHWEEK